MNGKEYLAISIACVVFNLFNAVRSYQRGQGYLLWAACALCWLVMLVVWIVRNKK